LYGKSTTVSGMNAQKSVLSGMLSIVSPQTLRYSCFSGMAEDTTDDHLYSANRGQTAKHL